VVNTCTVTENADREALRLMRGAKRKNPACRLIVTGCFAERDARALASSGLADAIVGTLQRERLAPLLDGIADEAAPSFSGSADGPERIACLESAEGGAVPWFGDRTRAFLKVQEGCDLGCSYCIIPTVRGRSRSVPPRELSSSLAALVARGYQEIVLTGVNTGDYGRDLTPRTTLASLLSRLLETPGLGRLRLNSLEPRTVTDEILRLLKSDVRLAPHLQVPLQSGCDRVLGAMRRNYGTRFYAGLLERLRREIPTIGLGADVIVGFPGESEEEFEETCAFISASQLNYLHVFSYSHRPGTPASRLTGGVPRAVVEERSARLRTLGRELGLSFRRSLVGVPLRALVLYECRPDGRRRALTGNYIDMGIEPGSAEPNTLVEAAICEAHLSDTRGEVRAGAAA
jgi:threonylcarbamoyladenosine tRNA methylthiotransferase MtaB